MALTLNGFIIGVTISPDSYPAKMELIKYAIPFFDSIGNVLWEKYSDH